MKLYDKILKKEYPSSNSLYEDIGLLNVSRVTFKSVLKDLGIGDTYIHELADGIVRVNYGQYSEINGLAGMQ